jgi:hypothetical protein
MADGFGINGAATGAAMPGVSSGSQAADAAANLPKAPTTEQPAPNTVQGTTTYSSDPAVATQVHSKVVARLLEQGATIYGPGLAKLPLPGRPDGVPRQVPKKPAGPMGAPRSLDGGNSPLAPGSLADARGSYELLGDQPQDDGEANVLANAQEGAWRMPSRHGLVAYTTNDRGDAVYLTQDRWLHIRENHMDAAPQPRGKRTTTYWPTRYTADGGSPTMNDQQVIGVIIDAARKGTLRNEVRDTRMAEYDLPADQAEAYGVSEAKVSMAPDGLVLSAFPGAGRNVLAVYEVNDADHAELAKATSTQATNANADGEDTRMFKTNIASTSFG